MNNFEILNSLLAAMRQQQLQMPQQQQQQPSPQQMAFNPLFINQILQNFSFPFHPSMLPPMPGSPMMPPMNERIKMTPKVNKETAAPLQKWFDTNIQNPYPTEEDKRMLKNLTGFTDTQLGDWLRNKRRNYKKNHQGNVPWTTPTTTLRKRRASSLSTHQNDSTSSPDSVSTAHSSPILSMPPPETPVSTIVKQEPSDTSPPEKRAKFHSVNELIQ